MPSGRPFLFCRYDFTVYGERLSFGAQLSTLQELQGRPVGEDISKRYLDSVVMRPRKHKFKGWDALSWSVGHIIDKRVVARYNKAKDEIDLDEIDDGGVRYSDFVAIPGLQVLAVDDRTGEQHLGGKGALNRLRAVVRMIDGADLTSEFDATPQDFEKALETWKISSFKFTVRPNNPRPVSRLARDLADQMKKDGIGILVGSAKPVPKHHIAAADDGLIAAAADLVEAGYGQAAVAGRMPGGREAEIKKPRFDYDVETNEAQQNKRRQLRVYVDDEDLSEDQVKSATVESLGQFYGE